MSGELMLRGDPASCRLAARDLRRLGECAGTTGRHLAGPSRDHVGVGFSAARQRTSVARSFALQLATDADGLAGGLDGLADDLDRVGRQLDRVRRRLLPHGLVSGDDLLPPPTGGAPTPAADALLRDARGDIAAARRQESAAQARWLRVLGRHTAPADREVWWAPSESEIAETHRRNLQTGYERAARGPHPSAPPGAHGGDRPPDSQHGARAAEPATSGARAAASDHSRPATPDRSSAGGGLPGPAPMVAAGAAGGGALGGAGPPGFGPVWQPAIGTPGGAALPPGSTGPFEGVLGAVGGGSAAAGPAYSPVASPAYVTLTGPAVASLPEGESRGW